MRDRLFLRLSAQPLGSLELLGQLNHLLITALCVELAVTGVNGEPLLIGR